MGGRTNDVVHELTGRPAEDFETTVGRYAALPFARKTFTNRLRALVNFLRVPFHPGYNLARYDLEHSFPTQADARLSIDSNTWRHEHRVEKLVGTV